DGSDDKTSESKVRIIDINTLKVLIRNKNDLTFNENITTIVVGFPGEYKKIPKYVLKYIKSKKSFHMLEVTSWENFISQVSDYFKIHIDANFNFEEKQFIIQLGKNNKFIRQDLSKYNYILSDFNQFNLRALKIDSIYTNLHELRSEINKRIQIAA
ncbi:hypothetical protein BVX93_02275, partial [bacterium B13(2017)]